MSLNSRSHTFNALNGYTRHQIVDYYKNPHLKHALKCHVVKKVDIWYVLSERRYMDLMLYVVISNSEIYVAYTA